MNNRLTSPGLRDMQTSEAAARNRVEIAPNQTRFWAAKRKTRFPKRIRINFETCYRKSFPSYRQSASDARPLKRREATMPLRIYRSLQRECHIQAGLTGHKETREVLAKMEREYKVIADWLESRQQAEQQTPSKEQGHFRWRVLRLQEPDRSRQLGCLDRSYRGGRRSSEMP
jgi:hypothetical protein